MSEPSLSDDELLSSHLDGELTVDERARLERRLTSEPELRERLDALRAAQALTATAATPLVAADTDRMIAAALAASSTSANVTDLTAERSRRSVWPARLATAAAGVVALALSVSVLSSIDTGDSGSDAGSGDTATTADERDVIEALEGGDDTAADFSAEADLSPDDGDEGVASSDVGEAAMVDELPYAFSMPQLQLFEEDALFDPLADDLGDYDNSGGLAIELSTQLSAFRSQGAAATTTTNVEPEDTTADGAGGDAETAVFDRTVLLDAAAERLDGLGFDACPQFPDLVIDHFGTDIVTAADYAKATENGVPVAVGVFELPNGQAVGLVVDLATCRLRSVPLG